MSILPINLPARVSANQPIKAEWANSIREAIERLANRRFSTKKGAGISASDINPLTLVAGSDVDQVQVVPGQVNVQTPTLGGTSLDASPAPNFTCTAATTHFWIKCVGVFGSPDTYTITIETSASAGSPPASASVSATGFTSCFYIGYVTFADGAITGIINQYEGGNLGVESFGSVNLWWKR